ncbi:MAG: YitT family protein [Lachnospiraceae bacterium]|jgi:uncharacterized membrane-anchored protein YitT (DUF2179 family)|nr:YitT family protein [Lachnospiraceae bacterium]
MGEHEIKKQYLKEQMNKYGMVLAGAVLYSMGVNFFIVPVSLYSGGVVGISQVIRSILVEYCHIHFPGFIDISGIIYFLINVPLLFLAYKEISRRFFVKTVMAVGIQTLMMTLLPIPTVPILDDVLAACLTGAILCGFGAGLTLKAGGCSGGTDILGVYLTKKMKSFSVGKLNTIINFCLYAVCAVLFNISTAIYSIIYSVFMSNVTDRVHSQNIMTTAIIFTKSNQIQDAILKELNRSATLLKGIGAYTKQDVNVLITAVSKYEFDFLRRVCDEKDPHAFIINFNKVSISGNFEKHLDE